MKNPCVVVKNLRFNLLLCNWRSNLQDVLRMVNESNDEIADASDKKEITDPIPIGDDGIEEKKEGELKLAKR